MAIPHLLVHEKKDTVGVVAIEGLKAGTDMLCVVTADNSSFNLKSKMDVPIGHKIALTDIKKGDTVIKYGRTSAKPSPISPKANTSTFTTSRPSGGNHGPGQR
jgi:(2R)-sulfolactate sulfo-lyase subunit alpha